VRITWKVAVALAGSVLVTLLIAVGVFRWGWGDSVVALSQSVHAQYGIDVPLALLLFGGGELVFIGSTAMMLREAGSQVTWRTVRAFKLKDLNLGNRRMMGWLWVNRASWIVPWVAVIALSLGKVPWWVSGAALAEVAATFAVGLLITLGLKLPWWNRARKKSGAE
jgi:hypothetical protein